MPEVGPLGNPSLLMHYISDLDILLQSFRKTSGNYSQKQYIDLCRLQEKQQHQCSGPRMEQIFSEGLSDPYPIIKTSPLNSTQTFCKRVDDTFGKRNIKHLHQENSSLHIDYF